MKYLLFFGLIMIPFSLLAQDDLYFDPSTDYVVDKNTSHVNEPQQKYSQDQGYIAADYDQARSPYTRSAMVSRQNDFFPYSNRLRRFHRPTIRFGMGFHDPLFMNPAFSYSNMWGNQWNNPWSPGFHNTWGVHNDPFFMHGNSWAWNSSPWGWNNGAWNNYGWGNPAYCPPGSLISNRPPTVSNNNRPIYDQARRSNSVPYQSSRSRSQYDYNQPQNRVRYNNSDYRTRSSIPSQNQMNTSNNRSRYNGSRPSSINRSQSATPSGRSSGSSGSRSNSGSRSRSNSARGGR